MINRFSSRVHPLDHSFLTERLRGTQRYDRIAGFFSSSILEVAGEELESVAGSVRLVCNSAISADDVTTAKKAAQAAMRREWCDAEPKRAAGGGQATVPAPLRLSPGRQAPGARHPE
jgi:hypothetical protein